MLFWIILILGLAGIFFLVKLTHFKNNLILAWTFGFILFLVLTFIKVSSSNHIEINSPSGVFSAIRLYFSWLGQVASNIKVITGNAIRMDWFPSN
jgi:hypothetical protein